MSIIICIFVISILWIYSSSCIYKYFENFSKNDSYLIKKLYISLSIGFIFLFAIIGSINIILHYFGITYHNLYFLLSLPTIIIIFDRTSLIKFSKIIKFDIKELTKSLFINLDRLSIILLSIIFIQLICLTIRIFLPITHGDALSQYFYDSLQISRLENLSIPKYYEIGEYFRTDSLASFFDAFILQISDNWTLVRLIRATALFLIVFSSLELGNNIGILSLKKKLLLIAVILSLPDVWAVTLSGKHDGYVFLFELTGIYSVFISIISKNNFSKIAFSSLAICIGIFSSSIRLSSLTFLIIGILLVIYYFFNMSLNLYLKELKHFIYSVPFIVKLFLFFSLLSPLIIACMNYQYFDNPLFWLSPPGFLKIFFPNAIYGLNYEEVKESLTLRNINPLIKPIATFLYSTLGIEPIRYGLNKFKDTNILLMNLSSFFNYIGPKSMMVSILSFSPFTLLTYLGLTNIKENTKKTIFIFATLWILLWSISIPYTRVALGSSLSILIIGFSEPTNFKFKFHKNIYISSIKKFTFYYGLLATLLFTIWSLSNLYDLPLNNLLNLSQYSRTELSREYLKYQNKILGKTDSIPTLEFEKDWQEIEVNNKNNLIFLKAPGRFAYFMNKGLIIKKTSNITFNNEKKLIVYEIDSNQNIKEIY